MTWLLRLVALIAFTVNSPLVDLTHLPAIHADTLFTDPDPVLIGIGDIATCNSTHDTDTAALVDNIAGTIATLGDNAYADGTLEQFVECYEPTWGRHKARTRPTPGNHDYHTDGAAGYYTYFGPAASPLDAGCTAECKGYYSYELGAWHIIALNSEIDMDEDSEQAQWLQADLAAHPNVCTLAYWHRPRFSSGSEHGNSSRVRPLWELLYDHGADVVLNGHEHSYERFAPQTPEGQADPGRGISEFVVGTGGAGLYDFGPIQPNSEARNSSVWGVLKLTLHAASYDWEFVPVAGQTFTDRGSAECVSSDNGPSTQVSAPSISSTPSISATPGVSAAPGISTTPDISTTLTTTSMLIPTGTTVLTPIPTETTGDILFVGSSSGGKAGEINFNDEDVLAYVIETKQWLNYFNGTGVTAGVDMDALAQLADGSLLFSLEMDSYLGALGLVDDSDILRFVPTSPGADVAGNLEWYFDGSDVGLERNDEDVDALAISNDGRLVVSVRSSFEISGTSGRGEDLIAFTAARLGQATEGTWSFYFDGSDVGLTSDPSEGIKGLWIDPANGDIYITTSGSFTVTNMSGTSSDILVCSPASLGNATRCNFHMYWRGLDNGFGNEEIDVIDIHRRIQQVTVMGRPH